MSEPPAPDPPRPARLHLRVLLGSSVAMGPGKADFLAAVSEVGSIVGAGRALGLSYKKARTLFDELNSAFCGPLVETVVGGRTYGGARLTPLGAEVLACYRAIERRATKGARADLARLAALAKATAPLSTTPSPSGGVVAHPPVRGEPAPNEGGAAARPARRKRAAGQRSSV